MAARRVSASPERDAFLRHVVARTNGKAFDPAHPSRVEVDRHGAYRFLVRFHNGEQLRIEVSIEARTRQESKAVFARLHHHRLAIEQALGYRLTWEEKPNSLRSTIYTNYPDQADLHHDASSTAALDWVVTQISRLQAAITPPANHGE